MSNAYLMSASLEARKNAQATMITAGFAGLMVLLMFLLKWELPVFEQTIQQPGIEVQLNLPEEPTVIAKGGGGGGNTVKAVEPAGIAPPTPTPVRSGVGRPATTSIAGAIMPARRSIIRTRATPDMSPGPTTGAPITIAIGKS